MADKTEGLSARFQMVLNTIAAVGMIVASMAIISNSRAPGSDAPKRPSVDIPKEPIAVDDATVSGARSARWVMIEYADFQCPACTRFARSVWPALQTKYVDSGQLAFAFKHLPLGIHEYARGAARAADCAAKQGRFWELHGILFGASPQLDEKELPRLAQMAGLNLTQFGTCSANADNNSVARDEAEAKRLGLKTTPTFMFGRRNDAGTVDVRTVIQGTGSLEAFRKIIDSIVK